LVLDERLARRVPFQSESTDSSNATTPDPLANLGAHWIVFKGGEFRSKRAIVQQSSPPSRSQGD